MASELNFASTVQLRQFSELLLLLLSGVSTTLYLQVQPNSCTLHQSPSILYVDSFSVTREFAKGCLTSMTT